MAGEAGSENALIIAPVAIIGFLKKLTNLAFLTFLSFGIFPVRWVLFAVTLSACQKIFGH
jgi:hypothetical protein